MAPSHDAIVSSEDWSATGGLDTGSLSGAISVTTSRSRGATSGTEWVQKTYQMATEGSLTQPSVLSWSEDGESFEIRDVEALKNNLLPKYHGSTLFESFKRRLRRYNFQSVKTETVTKSSTGPCAAVVLSFKHESFQRNRPDLLGKVTIVSHQRETVKPTDEKHSVSNALSRLEKVQADMRATMKHVENQSLDQKTRIDHLRQEVISKDEIIRCLEFRLERLENTVLLASDPKQPEHRAHSLWAPLGGHPTRGESNSSFLSHGQLFTGPSASPKRQISAVDLLPLLQASASYGNDEPTLKRSKNMKYSQGMALNDVFDGIMLSRQTTPIVWVPRL